MKPTDFLKEDASGLNIGDPVIITGKVQFQGKTGDIVDFGKDKRFVIVNLYNYGKHSFNASDVSYNDYAESGDEQEYLSQFEGKEDKKTGTIFVGHLKGTDPASKTHERLVGEAKSLQSKFEKHLAKHGYDVAEKGRYWEQKLKDIDAQIKAWDEQMAARKAKQGVAEGDELNVGIEAHGVRGADSKKWRKKFKSQEAFEKWLDANEGDVEVLGTREVNLNDMFEQGVAEGNKSYPKTWHDIDPVVGQRVDKMSQDEKVKKGYAHPNTLKKDKNKGVAEGEDLSSESALLMKLAKVVKSVQTPEQYAAAKKYARMMWNKLKMPYYGSFRSKHMKAINNLFNSIESDLRAKRRELGLKAPHRDDFEMEAYDPSYDPDYRPYEKPEQDPDAWKQQRDLEEPATSTSTVTIRDAEGNVVLQFPSTGGYYGDVRTAKAKGFDTESGDYDIKWQKNEDSCMTEDSGVTSEQVASEIVRRIIFKHKDAISAFGPEAIMAAAREVGEYFAGWDELGTSDIGIATKYTLEKLDQMSRSALGESASAGGTSAGAVATTPAGGSGKNVGSLFGGTYKQKRTKKLPGTK